MCVLVGALVCVLFSVREDHMLGAQRYLGLALASSLWGLVLKVFIVQVVQVVVVVQHPLQRTEQNRITRPVADQSPSQ